MHETVRFHIAQLLDQHLLADIGHQPALIVEDGRSLTESFAILHNIAARNPANGLGATQDTREFDELNAMLSFLHTSLHSSLGYGWSTFKLEKNDRAGQDTLRALARKLAGKDYAYLEKELEGRAWLVGDRKTIADAYFIGIAR